MQVSCHPLSPARSRARAWTVAGVLALSLYAGQAGAAHPARLRLPIETGFLPVRESPNLAPTHQGWCTDGTFYYTIHTDRIAKRRRDARWTPVQWNTHPFVGLMPAGALNHLGDCDVDRSRGLIFIPVDRYQNRTRTGAYDQIVAYRTSDLSLAATYDVSGLVGARGASGVAVDARSGSLILALFTDASTLLRFGLTNGRPLPPIHVDAPLRGLQGVAVAPDGRLFVSGRLAGRGKVVAAVSREGGSAQFLRLPIENTIEGLGFDDDGLLGVLDNRRGDDPSIIRFFDVRGLVR